MITNIPSGFANAVAPFAPLGSQPVGQESTDLKFSSFKSLEQPAPSAREENRRSPEDRPNEVGEQERTRSKSAVGDPAQMREQERKQEENKKQARLEQEQKEIRELSARDREVRMHEQAHAAIGGKYAGSPVYKFERGPDGVNYAVGGEVSIDVSPIAGNPEATIAKAQQIRRAANAPAEPSSQDRRVAAESARLEAQARAELRQEQILKSREEPGQKSDGISEVTKEKTSDEVRREKEEEQKELREQLEIARANRSEFLAEFNRRNVDINRRLMDIGVLNNNPLVGVFLDKNA